MVIDFQQDERETKYVYDKLIEFNADSMPHGVPSHYEQINLILKDEDGQIRGGILGYWTWNWVHVDILWIDESMRGLGYGSQLLGRIEQFAMERGCECIELDTYGFQAPGFYQKHGYEVFGKLEFAGGSVIRYYMVKRLPSESSTTLQSGVC